MRLTSIIAALLIAGGLWYWFALRHDMAADQDPMPSAAAVQETETPTEGPKGKPVPVVVYTSQAQQTRGTLVIRGRTEANRNVKVASETTGRVISQALPSGSRVTAGQVLCRLNPGVRAAELAEAQASLAEAQVEAEAATQLKRKGFTAETTLRSAEARLQAAQARLDRVNWDIAQLDIIAPFDGVLESDTAEVGTLMTSGTVCADVIDLTKVKVTGFVAEQEVDLLSLGQSAKARLINGVTAEGQITFLSRMADEQTRTFAVEVTVDNADGAIRDGMTAELQVALPAKTAHLLPQQALTLDDEGRMGVRVNEDGVARFYPVQILTEDGKGVWLGGLPEHVDIIVVGQEFVRDGRAIEPTQADLSMLQ